MSSIISSSKLWFTLAGIIGIQTYRYITQEYKVALRGEKETEYTLIYSNQHLEDVIKQKKPWRYNKIFFHFHPSISDKDRETMGQILSTYIFMINSNRWYFGSVCED